MIKRNSTNQINTAVKILDSGGVIAYPTDTLFGVGGSALDEKAVDRVFEIKGRDYSKPMSISVSNIQMLEKYVVVSNSARAILEQILPGPYTIILPKKPSISNLITAGSELVGIRIPDCGLILEIIEKFGYPIISTSANLSGEKDITKYEEIILPVDFVVKGECKYNSPSTVFDPRAKKILRRGICAEKIEQLLNQGDR